MNRNEWVMMILSVALNALEFSGEMLYFNGNILYDRDTHLLGIKGIL